MNKIQKFFCNFCCVLNYESQDLVSSKKLIFFEKRFVIHLSSDIISVRCSSNNIQRSKLKSQRVRESTLSERKQ